MAKKDYTDKYELLINPVTLTIKKPQPQRINMKDMTMEQADAIYAIENQRYLRKKADKSGKTASE
jgi:hypothetical protein